MAQSNFTGLRYREPVYRSLRELVMSYFEDFFNSVGEKTLVGYRGPINLKVFDRLDWMSSDAGLETLSNDMDRYTYPSRHQPLKWQPVLPWWTSAACVPG